MWWKGCMHTQRVYMSTWSEKNPWGNTCSTQAMGYAGNILGWEGRREWGSISHPQNPEHKQSHGQSHHQHGSELLQGAWTGAGLEQHSGHGHLRIHLKVIQGMSPWNENDNQGGNHGQAFHCSDNLQCQAVVVVTNLVFCPPPATKTQTERGPLLHNSET